MRKCHVCTHKDRYQIDRDIVNQTSYQTISNSYGVTVQQIKNHVHYGHVSKPIQAAHQEQEAKHGLELTSLLKECLEISLGSAREARAARDYRSIGSIMSGPYKAAEILSRATSDDGQESGLQAMRAELKAMREGHVETPTT